MVSVLEPMSPDDAVQGGDEGVEFFRELTDLVFPLLGQADGQVFFLPLDGLFKAQGVKAFTGLKKIK